jgi:Domain of unknown function (DUF4189)
MNLVKMSSTKLALSALTIAITLSSSWNAIAPAHAEGGRCPEGMYPIGGGNAGWEGCAPIPGYPAPSQPSQPSGQWVNSYGALIWASHPDGTPTYAWAGKFDSQTEATSAAMNSCAAEFQNCRLANSFSNGFLAIAKDNRGGLYQGFAGKRRRAERNARKECEAAGGKDCKIEKVVDSSARYYR